MNNETVMKALFAQQRMQVIKFKIEHPDLMSNAYAYAWIVGLYPFFHDNDESVPDLPHKNFSHYFNTSADFGRSVIKFLDERWHENEVPSFYELEDHFGGNDIRCELIHVCKYAFLDDRFDDRLWNALLTPIEHPIEATSITDELESTAFFIR